MTRLRNVVALLCTLALPVTGQVRTAAQNDAMNRALTAERRGAFADAAALFGGLLAQRPADAAALMGMERVLPPINRSDELLPLVVKALAADSTNVGVLQVAVRAYSAAGRVDLSRRYVELWAARAPGDPAPYQEWSSAAAAARDRATARAALELGNRRLSDKTALAPDLAQLLQGEGDIAGATREWALAVHGEHAYRNGAATLLAQVAPTQRTVVRNTLLADGSLEARQLLGLLELGWGEVADGTALVRTSLPTEAGDAVAVLQGALDALRTRTDRDATLALGTLLEALATRQTGATQVHTQLDAARAFADAGAERDARRLLAAAAANPAAPPGTAAASSAAMLGVLLAEGKAAEAEKVLASIAPGLEMDERDRETRRVAQAFARNGDFAHAEALIANDSSVAGFDLRGRLRLYAGDLAAAATLLKNAGPFDDTRDQAVERVTLLTLLQAVGKDSLAALGRAMLALDRGDSASAQAALDSLATGLPPDGAAETRLLAGQIALGRRDTTAALRLLRAADDTLSPGVAPAARLALAQVDVARGRASDARALLEQLILQFPASAVVPEARRLHDRLAGAIPGGNR